MNALSTVNRTCKAFQACCTPTTQQLKPTVITIGDRIPNFTRPNFKGQLIEIQTLLQKNPLFLIFNRGHWYPYDSLKLWQLQTVRSRLLDPKIQPILICPQVFPELIKIWKQQSNTVEFLIEKNLETTRKFRLIQLISPAFTSIYRCFCSRDLRPVGNKFEGMANGVYEVNSAGRIVYEYSDLQHTKQFRPDNCLLVQDEDY